MLGLLGRGPQFERLCAGGSVLPIRPAKLFWPRNHEWHRGPSELPDDLVPELCVRLAGTVTPQCLSIA